MADHNGHPHCMQPLMYCDRLCRSCMPAPCNPKLLYVEELLLVPTASKSFMEVVHTYT
jgi:hypothetical protein